MVILTIKISNKEFSHIKAHARRAGFKNPTEWALDLVEKNLSLEESPRMKPEKIILEMKKSSRYSAVFLRDLKESLTYADKAA